MDKIFCNVWQLFVQTQHVGSCIVISFCNQKTLVTTFLGINLLHLFCQIEKKGKFCVVESMTIVVKFHFDYETKWANSHIF